MFRKKFIFLACVILLCISCISVISAADLNDNSTITKTTTESSTHAMENVQKNDYKENSYNSGLDTSNSATTNIGEQDTSQNSETDADKTDTTTESTKAIAKKTGTTTVKTAAVFNPTNWNGLRDALTSSNNEVTINLAAGTTYVINSNTALGVNQLKNVTINGNGAKINGQGLYRFLTLYGDYTSGKTFNFKISNVNFENCGQKGVMGQGGVIQSEQGPGLTFINCNFINCNANNGACFYLKTNPAKLTLKDSTFKEGSTNNGGIADFKGNLTVDNCKFINITAQKSSATFFIRGGSIVKITNSQFEGCKVTGYDTGDSNMNTGGAIHICAPVDVYIFNNTFKNNHASGRGTIFIHSDVDEYDTGIISNNTFLNNSASIGGALCIVDSNGISIENNSFTNNRAPGNDSLSEKSQGGAVYVGENAIVSLKNNTFTNNTAETGSAIYAKKSISSTKDKFYKNVATVGTIYMDESDLDIDNAIFDSNSAQEAGAIWTDRKIKSSNTLYKNNSATTGGAINLNTSQSSLVSNNDNYESNSAASGGAIRNYRGSVTITKATINKNNATQGGFVYNSNTGTLSVTGSKITNSIGNDGSVLYNHQGATATLTGNNITDNKATNSVIHNVGTLTISNNNITRNNVTDSKGYVIYNDQGTITVTGNVFTNNTDYKRDMLLESNNDKYTVRGNTYNGNWLETTFKIDEIKIVNDQAVNTPVALQLRKIYNSTVMDGNLTVSINGQEYKKFEVSVGAATIIIPQTQFPKDSKTSLKVDYSTATRSYQPSKVDTTISPFTNTSIKITYVAPEGEVVNKTITYTINLTDFHGTGVKGKKLDVTVNGTTKEYTTDDKGLIRIPIIYVASDYVEIRAQFLGDEFYNHSVSELKHYVRKINTKVNLTVPTGKAPEDKVLINFTLEDEYGKVIPNKFVTVRILDGSTPLVAEDVKLDEKGNGTYTFTPVKEADYEVEVIFRDENDKVYNYSINKSSLSVKRIHTESTLWDDFIKDGELTTHFKVLLFDENSGDGLADKPVNIYANITKVGGAVIPMTFPGARTNGTGYYEFTVTRTDLTENITIFFSYDGDNRYVGTEFIKPFNGLKIMRMNITATDTYINVTNNISISVVNDENQPIAGKFVITREANDNEKIAEIDIPDTGKVDYLKYLNDTYQEEVILYGGFVHPDYIRVYQKLSFRVDKIPTRISAAVLNETVYNTTLSIDVRVPSEEYPMLQPSDVYNITGLNVVVRHRTENGVLDVGKAELVDGKAVITLENVDRHQDYDLIIDYEGNYYFLGREHEIKVKPQKLPVTLTPIVISDTAGKVMLRVNVTSDHDPSVDNGTVTIYLDDGWEPIGTGEVRNGYTLISIDEGYLDKIGTYPIDIRYNNSLTFQDADVDYDLGVVGRLSSISASVNNTVIHNVTADVVLKDAETGALLAYRNITAYNTKGQVIGLGTTDANGFVTIKLNFTQTGPHIVNFTYTGNTTYKGSSTLLPINVDYRNASIQEEILNNVTDNVTIKVNLKDKDNGTAITKGDIAVLFKDGVPIQEIEIDNEDGIVIFSGLELPAGDNSLIIRLKNDGTYDDTDHEITVGVEYRNLTASFEQSNYYVTESTIIVTLTDKDTQESVHGDVLIYDSNNNIIGYGRATVNELFINLPAGNHTITVTYPRSGKYDTTSVTGKVEILKFPTVIVPEVNVTTTTIGNSVEITGSLNTSDYKERLLESETVILRINGKVVDETDTDEYGNFRFVYTTENVGEMFVNVTFKENEHYLGSTGKTTFNVAKQKTIIRAYNVVGIIGEDIVLTAKVTDEDGNPVTGGNLVFKLNGRTLRTDGRFDTNDSSPWKFSVVNGLVTFRMKADLYLRAGKNISASYSGSYKYEAGKSNIAKANIKKRSAELKVKVVPKRTKFDNDVVFIVIVKDVTKNSNNTSSLTSNANIMLKINGKTIKDKTGQIVRVPVDNAAVTYTYHVPRGTAGLDNNLNVMNYTVEAVYNNSLFYPDTRNSSKYNVDVSPVNVNFKSVNIKGNTLSIKANFTDYNDKLLVGNNKVCVKINGITYRENNETKYFTVVNGRVNLSGIKIAGGVNVKSVTLVTGERRSYESARVTVTDITTS